MQTVNIHRAKTHLSRLVDEAAKGEPFIIAKAGKPMVKVVPLDAEDQPKPQRLGFMKGSSRFPTTSIRCAPTKSSRCSMAANECRKGQAF